MDKKWLLFIVGALLVVFGSFFKITHYEMLSEILLPVGMVMEAVALIWIVKEKLTERKQNKT